MDTPVTLIRNHRLLLWRFALRGLTQRYKGSLFGLLWTVITPLCMLGIYTFMFSVVFQAGWGHGVGDSKMAFAIVLLSGLTIYQIFSESVNASIQAVSNNPNYVKKVVFPLEILPFAGHISFLLPNLVWFLMVVAGTWLFMGGLSLKILLLPAILIPLSFLTIGISWFCASLGVFIRDLNHFITIVLRMLLFLTPIFYDTDRIPHPWNYLLLCNPLAHFVDQTRRILIYNQWPDWYVLAGISLFSLAVFQLGYLWFMRTKKGFADVL